MGLIAAILLSAVGAKAEVDFNMEIRPILNTVCVECHGGVKKAGGISLQFREMAMKEGESGAVAIVPGKPEESEAYLRLVTDDKTERMPKKKPALKPAQIAAIKQWITEGAHWAQHWAYAPLVKPAVPANGAPTTVDAFIRERLAAEKLAPAPEAPRAVQLRRVSLDLTGLPPTPEEVAAFEKDAEPGAWARQVDRLLASPHFGERWAALWMDLARYSDTKGYESDKNRPMWPYRDWLVRALNADMPFDEFTIKQLAGDLMQGATDDDRIATAMHRLTSTNDEGGTDNEEFRVAAVLDRVNTTGEVWLGTSVGCVQCHDHPYDPFRHAEYYQLMAFFNNTDDADRNDESPTMEVLTKADERPRLLALRAEIEKLGKERDALKKAEPRATGKWQPLTPATATVESNLSVALAKDEVHITGSPGATDTTTVLAPFAGKTLAAVKLETLPQSAAPGGGPGLGRDGNFVLTGFEVALVLPDRSELPVEFVKAEADYEQRGHLIAHALKNPDADKSGWAISGALNKPHFVVFHLRAPLDVPPGALLRARLRHDYTNGGKYQGALLAHFRLAVSAEAVPPLGEASARAKAIDERIKKATAERDSIGVTPLPVMTELRGNKARQSQIFTRGNWMTKAGVVQPGTPASLPPLPADAPRDRLGLACWLMSKDNPLTARVAANRLWEQLFGTGLVETAEDFGTKGEPPSHPALLDWLAASYRDDFRWSTKRLLREIVLCAAYRQDAASTPELNERDPRNRLLARGPRVRLSAEMVRDQALAVSGLLARKMGGPSVMPPQPEGVIAPSPHNGGKPWTNATGEDRYRRAIYTFWKRTNPYPSLLLFDSAERALCTSRRLRTNTPLQALTLLNDPVYVEAAAALAKRMCAAGGAAPEGWIAQGWRLITLQAAPPDRVEKLAALYRDSLAHFQKNPDAAKQLAGTPEDAALTNVASVLFNLDQALTK